MQKRSARELYHIDSQLVIGKGDHGIVYRARSRQTNIERAVRMMPRKSMPNNEFENEMQLLYSLDHPYIINIYEVFHDERYFYVVMDVCEGGKLIDQIRRLGQLSEPMVAHWFGQILSAVSYMHGRDICHRDLNLENLLIRDKVRNHEDLKQSTVKVIDFDFACYFTPGNRQPMCQKVGYVHYCAPQVLNGSYSHACDLWSCGVIAHVMLCGSPPFTRTFDQDVKVDILKGLCNGLDSKIVGACK